MAEEALVHSLHLNVRTPEDTGAGKPKIMVRVIQLDERGIR